jgi:hypothetical protein
MHVCQAFQWNWFKIVPVLAVGAIVTAGILHGAGPATPASGVTAGSKAKVDPVEANGAIFEGWPKPDLALVFTAELDGYLEPCGCAGLENQKGGLKRRFTMLKQLRDKGWPVVAVDGGSQEKDTGVQAEKKMDFAYHALISMGYDVIGLGGNDLNFELMSILINYVDEKTTPMVSANVGIGAFDSGMQRRFKIIEKNGIKIGVTTALGAKEVAAFSKSSDYQVKDPQQAIPEFLADLRKANCDHLVLLVNGKPDEAKDLARRFNKEFDWVLMTHGAEEPPKDPAKIDGTPANIVEVGHKGMYAVVVGFYKKGSPSFRYQRVPLDHRFEDSPEITKLQVQYQQNLKNLGLAGLGLKAVPHPTGRKFAGSKTCEDCHTKAAAVFKETPHARATETLLTRTTPPRIYDPECLSCHVTGWEPQKQIPFETGYLSMEKTPNLVGNGCENCHGPAAKHAAVENGEVQVNDTERAQLREALRLKILPNEGNKKDQVYDKGKVVQMCMQCHDLDNSPDFDFQMYWPKVKHSGKD